MISLRHTAEIVFEAWQRALAKSRVGGSRYAATCLRWILTVIVMVSVDGNALAGRDRPRLDTSLGFNVLLSDQGTLLRGVSLSWDGGIPTAV
jgi:hypothetical protein